MNIDKWLKDKSQFSMYSCHITVSVVILNLVIMFFGLNVIDTCLFKCNMLLEDGFCYSA